MISGRRGLAAVALLACAMVMTQLYYPLHFTPLKSFVSLESWAVDRARSDAGRAVRDARMARPRRRGIRVRGAAQAVATAAELITASVSPVATDAPTAIGSSDTTCRACAP